jgi:hypothetical protein
MLMEDLLDNAGELFDELFLQGYRELLPEGGGSVEHGGAHSFTSKRNWSMASGVNFAQWTGRG